MERRSIHRPPTSPTIRTRLAIREPFDGVPRRSHARRCLPAPTAEGGTATTFLARVFADTANFAGHARGPRTADRCNGGVRDQLYFIVGWRSASNRDARQWRNFSASGFIIRMYLDIRPKHGRSDGSAPPWCSDGGLSRYVARAVTGESTGRSHLGKRRFAAARNSEPEHT